MYKNLLTINTKELVKILDAEGIEYGYSQGIIIIPEINLYIDSKGFSLFQKKKAIIHIINRIGIMNIRIDKESVCIKLKNKKIKFIQRPAGITIFGLVIIISENTKPIILQDGRIITTFCKDRKTK